MRKIDSKPIKVFLALFISSSALAIFSALAILQIIPLGAYKAITTITFSVFMVYLFNMAAYRFFLWKWPLSEGQCIEGSRSDFIYNVYILFYLILFNPLIYTLLIPVPIMRCVYIALGARFGKNTYSTGVILDPPLVQLGDNTIIGFGSVLCAHAVEGNRLYLSRIKIGSNVTIGMKSIVMAGVTIEDGGIIAAGSLVKKGSYIKAGEIWGGIPAKPIQTPDQKITVILGAVSGGFNIERHVS